MVKMKTSKTAVIEESLIIKQVEKICSSNEFITKELLCRFLSYIISEHLAGRDNNLKGYTIGVNVFNRDEDFDPGQDALVRINAGRLRRFLDLYYLKEGKKDPVRIEIPKGAYTPKINLNPNTEMVSENETVKVKSSFDAEPKIAVLSFLNLTGNPENDYLAQGICEEISVELTRYEDLSVYNFNILSAKKSKDHNLKKIAKKRGVRFILEGAVNKSDKQIKVLARLIDLMDEKQIWAQSYTREFNSSNIFDIQESIAKEISNIVGSEFGIIPQNLTHEFFNQDYKDMNVYLAVLKYYYFQIHMTREAGETAYEALTKAYENEPESATINALLGAFHGNRYALDLPGAAESYNLQEQFTKRAMALKPESLLVNSAFAFKCFLQNDKERFYQLVEKCLSAGLNTTLRLGTIAFYLCLCGDWGKGKKLLDNIMDRNTAYPLYFHGGTMLYYYRNGEYERALIEAIKYNLPAVFWSPMLKAAVHGQLGNLNDAKTNVTELIKLKPDFESKARYLISIFVKEDNLVSHILEGLRRAGMNV